MPNVYRRKILRTGNSLAITLPPSWLRYYNLKVGDEVELISNDDIRIRVKKVK